MLQYEYRRRGISLISLVCLVLLAGQSLRVSAQSQSSAPNKQDTPPEAGGPQTDVGPYAIPKKKEAPPAPPPEKPKKIEGMPDYSIRVNVPLVNVDVMVTTKDGQFINGLKKDNFKIYEDGAPQAITNFGQSEAPITAVLWSSLPHKQFMIYDMLNASYAFANGLKKEDYVLSFPTT